MLKSAGKRDFPQSRSVTPRNGDVGRKVVAERTLGAKNLQVG
jgi:hypothetical protein